MLQYCFGQFFKGDNIIFQSCPKTAPNMRPKSALKSPQILSKIISKSNSKNSASPLSLFLKTEVSHHITIGDQYILHTTNQGFFSFQFDANQSYSLEAILHRVFNPPNCLLATTISFHLSGAPMCLSSGLFLVL